MSEEQVFFQGDDRLEGRLGRSLTGELRGGVVVAHPYPPNGASMDLPVIQRVAKCCREVGYLSLRFNFRGVGASQGVFSGTDERHDVTAALGFMRERLTIEQEADAGNGGGAELPMGLAGWSFGSVMAARAAADSPDVRALALVGFVPGWELLPVDTLERLALYRGPILAVCAENDHISLPDEVERVFSGLGLDFKLEVIHGADHYLMGRQREVGDLVAGFFAKELAG